ncbi:hypothetical protein [Adlercreutzia aquisgranensis]|uniref:hypothetical protein n=1 Tax=Adlercreutzia aquisgranensis TaxID=2941323 RepID=UPI001363B83A|nr:hypothetical protein [Adlercreutzia aquisgranensis]
MGWRDAQLRFLANERRGRKPDALQETPVEPIAFRERGFDLKRQGAKAPPQL